MSNEIVAAARRTLASASARVRQSWLWEASDSGNAEQPVEEGVTDFERVRTRVEPESQDLPRWGQALLERYPWLDRDEHEGDDEHDSDAPPSAMVHAGTASFFGTEDEWTVIGPGDVHAGRRGHTDPTWIVEALQHTDEAWPDADSPEEVVRDAVCARWHFRLDPNPRRSRLEVPPHSGSRAPRLAGQVWIDGDQRIRRASWTQLRRHRPRSPWKLRDRPPLRRTTELWDFGVAADIQLPDVKPDRTPWPIATAQLIWNLWRRKRAYARATTSRGR